MNEKQFSYFFENDWEIQDNEKQASKIFKFKETIYALSTPTGKSAIALIRISGKDSLKILKKPSFDGFLF